ncbi:FkbM family methyltransferase [Candidatus Bathyarchaeota archaeon]|nr:MAG: FkbM family methyltransferase [Candidatus Bathyarchaeota archaeon]
MIIDWRFIVSKHIINRKWENGFLVTFDTIFDHTEDFAKAAMLAGGKLYIDAGANCGMWTLQASKHYDQVIAIEPTKTTAKALKTNLRSNGIRNVKVIEAAVSDKNGQRAFWTWPDGPMGNSLYYEPVTYTSDYGVSRDPSLIRTITIDSLNVNPTMIKLDVEGAEFDAILGAVNTIARCRPKLFVEIHHPENEQKIIDTLPDYEWSKHHRLMQIDGKQPFYQTQMLGAVKEL